MIYEEVHSGVKIERSFGRLDIWKVNIFLFDIHITFHITETSKLTTNAYYKLQYQWKLYCNRVMYP